MSQTSMALSLHSHRRNFWKMVSLPCQALHSVSRWTIRSASWISSLPPDIILQAHNIRRCPALFSGVDVLCLFYNFFSKTLEISLEVCYNRKVTKVRLIWFSYCSSSIRDIGVRVLCNETLWTMSGGEPSSIKRFVSCVTVPPARPYVGLIFLFSWLEWEFCIRHCTGNGVQCHLTMLFHNRILQLLSKIR